MNKLSRPERKQILQTLLEGNSMRATARLTGASRVTISGLLTKAGMVSANYHDQHVRNISAKRVQCDEIWSFVYAKKKNVSEAKNAPDIAGDVWTWTALDTESKLIVSYLVGGREAEFANRFMKDLASRLATRVQLTTDSYRPYPEAVLKAFGHDVDFATLQKKVETSGEVKVENKPYLGKPDPKHISTSLVESQNSCMRQFMRRFTRRTKGYSKRFENHVHMNSLYFLHYNFCKIQRSVRMSPAMAAGITPVLYDVDWIVEMIEAAEPKPGPRGRYNIKKLV